MLSTLYNIAAPPNPRVQAQACPCATFPPPSSASIAVTACIIASCKASIRCFCVLYNPVSPGIATSVNRSALHAYSLKAPPHPQNADVFIYCKSYASFSLSSSRLIERDASALAVPPCISKYDYFHAFARRYVWSGILNAL